MSAVVQIGLANAAVALALAAASAAVPRPTRVDGDRLGVAGGLRRVAGPCGRPRLPLSPAPALRPAGPRSRPARGPPARGADGPDAVPGRLAAAGADAADDLGRPRPRPAAVPGPTPRAAECRRTRLAAGPRIGPRPTPRPLGPLSGGRSG